MDNLCIESDEESDEETMYCYKCDKKYDLEEDFGFCCDICSEQFHEECEEEITNEINCSNIGCYHCRYGSCFNNRKIGSYCTTCVPDDILDKFNKKKLQEEEAENEYMRINDTIPLRRKQLKDLLKEAGLKLRSDSKLCDKYIEYDIGDPDEIVSRMCEMRYLFDYCDMRKCLDKVEQEHADTLNNGYFPDCSVFDEAEEMALNNKEYPDVFPWQLKSKDFEKT